MGERLGTTPLDVSDARVYPVHYPRALAPLYGKLVLRHPGCDELVQDLTLRAANEGVVVRLACAERAEEHHAASADAEPPASARERLAEIDSLRREGLLSEDEERAIRDRVLREQLDERPPAEALRLLEALRGDGSLDEAEYRARRAEILDRF